MDRGDVIVKVGMMRVEPVEVVGLATGSMTSGTARSLKDIRDPCSVGRVLQSIVIAEMYLPAG